MSWLASVNELAGNDLYIQEDSFWGVKPELNVFTPIGAIESVFQYAGCPSAERTISGYVITSVAYLLIVDTCRNGTPTTLNTNGYEEDVFIRSVSGKLFYPLNMSFLALVQVSLVMNSPAG